MHYATYGRSRYRRKNNVNTKATAYEKSARTRRVAKQTTVIADHVEKKKNINRKEMMTSSLGEHIRAVAKEDDPPTAVVTDDINNNSNSRHQSASPATISSSLRDSYVSSSSTTPTLQSTSCSGCSSSNQSSYTDSGSSVYSEDDTSLYSGTNSSSEDSYSSQSYHTSPTIEDTISSSYSASIGYKRCHSWNGKTSHPQTTTSNDNNRLISSSFVHKSNHYNELNNSNGRESSRTIAAKRWLGFDSMLSKKNLIAKKKKFSFGSSKHGSCSVSSDSGNEDDVYEENSEEDGGSVESRGEGSIYEESIHSSDDEESQGSSYSTSSDDESSIGSNISTTQYESKPSFLRSSMKKIGTTGNQCKKVLSNVKIPIMLISGSSCKKMMMKRQSLLYDSSYEGSSFNDDGMNLSNYLTKTKKSLEQHQSTIARDDDGYTDGSMTYCSSSDGRISYVVEDGGEDEEEDGSSREENESSDRYINKEVANEEGDIVVDKIENNDADDSSSMIQQKLSIEEECIIEELLHENERLCKSFALLILLGILAFD